MVVNKLLDAFFLTFLGQGLSRCNYCGHHRKQMPEYFNLLAHLAGKHDGYDTQYVSFQSSFNRSLEPFGLIPEEVNNHFHWIYGSLCGTRISTGSKTLSLAP
ncbi:hypothetical protein JG687_00010290 [Phytophthora cactorum]|uniref:Uncharacterized protein n=1 Tax=Phytophthora cactorum TaxID=29920 RepID=A0A8T1U767_9STRA|nr:hypothetical protein JG687_00010290 [Phytophthora cactorum]